MKITFFCAVFENIGVEYLSTILKKNNHEVELVFQGRTNKKKNPFLKLFFPSPKIIAEKILLTNPDLIGFSVFSDHYDFMVEITQEIKKINKDIPIIFGGIHPTCIPATAIAEPSVDYVCVGEGEDAFLDLVTALANNNPTTNIQNIWAKQNNRIFKNDVRPLRKDLDAIPFPDTDLFEGKKPIFMRKKYSIFTGRGCKLNCNYCYNSAMRKIYPTGNFLRKRSISNIIAELKYAKKKYAPKTILFMDDIMFYDKQWMLDFCKEYKREINIPFTCNIHPKYMDESIAKTLRDANCFLINIGVQTVYEKTRTLSLNRIDSVEEMTEAMDLAKKHGFLISTNIMYNLPLQTEEEMVDIARFFNNHPCNVVLVFNLRYHPKLDIVDRAHELKILSDQEVHDINNGINYSPLAYSTKKVNKNLLALIYSASHLPKPVFNFLVKYKLYNSPTRLASAFMYTLWIAKEAYTCIFKRKFKLLGGETFLGFYFYIANYFKMLFTNIVHRKRNAN